ncbi:SLC13A1 isoform 3 [Pan troglodytes]|uniref:SLC13A1 isoform 3 n=1 Tax=Pan troglodytes TaxID=9598 RepID=A0A2J8QX77_PANTR|nr:SLC13A1 isoform 3 [Pan troglodytes]
MKFFSYILVYRRFLFVVFTVLVLLPLPIVLRTKLILTFPR